MQSTCVLVKKTHQHQNRNVVGRRMREVRLNSEPAVSQDDLSGRLAKMGVIIDQPAISRIESQTRYVMDYEAVAIAKALKVPVSRLFGEK